MENTDLIYGLHAVKRLVTRTIGTCCKAPVEALTAVEVIPTARCLGIIIASTPVASAVRAIDPKL